MVSFSGMLVIKESMSRLAIYTFGSCLQISPAKWNESVKVYSFSVKSTSIEYSEFLQPFDLLFRDVKQENLGRKSLPLKIARLLDTALSSY